MTKDQSQLPASPSHPSQQEPAAQALWSRRRLLKELGKAHGAMAGLLVLPTAWSKPLMEFASVGALTTLSAPRGGTPSNSNTTNPNTTTSTTTAPSAPAAQCMQNTLTLPFPANPSTVKFTVFWYGVDSTGVDYSATYDGAKGALTFTQLAGGQVTLTTCTGGASGNVLAGTLVLGLTAITGKFTLGFTTTNTARTWNAQPSENITLDFLLTQGTSPSLAISSPHSSHC